jgi:hypothetical protein
MLEDRESLEYLVGLKEVKTFEIDGETYSTAPLHRIPKVFDPTPAANAVGIATLTGLVDYIKNGVDNLKDSLIVHIVSHTQVKVYSELRADMTRSHFIDCNAKTPQITFERFMDIESFNIMLQSCFLENVDRAAALKVVGNVKEENVRTTGDSGVAQVVTAKAGVATVGDVIVPNPVTLCPFRTFPEVDQPESKFVFRMKDGPQAALFEADGGKWKIFAMQNIKAYLTEALNGCNVKIIS